MKKQRINWQKLWQEFLFSEFVSVRQFLVSKGLLDEDKPLPGGYAKKTKWWSEEKAKFWQEKLENFDLDDKQKQKFAMAIYQGVDVFAEMLLYYSKKQREKMKEGKKWIYVEELIKFWKLLEFYHKLKLWTEFDNQVNINLETNSDPIADLKEKLLNEKQ